MIESFACKRTQRLFEGAGCANAFRAFWRQAERKLQLLDSATTLDFLRSPPVTVSREVLIYVASDERLAVAGTEKPEFTQ